MEEDRATHEADPRLVTRIVGSYVRHRKIGVDQLAGLIAEVNRTLGGLWRGAPPAVPIKRSVGRDAVVCLECGFRNQMLRRHLRTAHGLEATAYRSRWNLSADHPLTAPSYSSRRSALAKGYGFGRKRQAVVSAPAPAIAAALPKRRGRPPKSPAATA
jgi:predicted transcriptional regulator